MWRILTIIPLDYFIISNQNIWHKLFYSNIYLVLHSSINLDFAIQYLITMYNYCYRNAPNEAKNAGQKSSIISFYNNFRELASTYLISF